ncbi:MAG: response regulator [Candidatus Binatia bacterium]
MHGGRVSAASAGIGRGATFEIRLPLVDPAEPASAAALPAKTPRRRVLVVDDNADAADSLVVLLDLDGHEAKAVYGAAAALAEVSAYEPDVVLLDIGLPEMDGYEVARRLRALTPWRPLRLIALTGYGHAEDRARALGAGFDDHIVKPVEFAALARTLAADHDQGAPSL